MRSPAATLALLSFIAITWAPVRAHAFGGTADNLPTPGNFVVSNRANVGFHHEFVAGAETVVQLDPELDYMVLHGLSLGAGVLLDWHVGPGFSHVDVGVVPQVGYDVTLSDTWSFWPRLAVTIADESGTFGSSLEITAPFLVHPAQHFFFGFGPGTSFKLAGPPPAPPDVFIFGTFLIGGYFDH
jgi:hypothetical protein